MNRIAQTIDKQGRLLATGQTTVYVAGDNGTFQTGLPKTYTVLTLGQYSGTTNIVLNGKTDTHSNNCVFDNRTRLMWLRYASASVGPASDGKLPWTTNAGGEGIFTYCAAANAAGLGGYADWRVPNKFEFLSILDNEPPNSLPNSTAFPSFAQDYYWSSSIKPDSVTQSHRLSSASAEIVSGTVTNAYRILLVRG